jgi:hypothetical protein
MKTVLAAFAMALALFASDVEKGNFGAESPGASKAKTTAKAKRNSYPFSGEIQSHDGKSLTLKGKKKSRVLLMTPETRVLKDGAAAKLKEGEYVSGSARKNADGKEEAVTVNLKGAKPAK